jgi:hypothetical protein
LTEGVAWQDGDESTSNGEPRQQLAAIGISHPPATPSTTSHPDPRLVADGVLPEPTPIPSGAMAYLRGELVQEGAKQVSKGEWAEKRDGPFRDCDTFEFSITPLATVPLPADGQYDGYFYFKGTKCKDTSLLAFTPNSCAGWNISGKGWTKLLTYRVGGTVTTDMRLQLFRFSPQSRRPPPAPSPGEPFSATAGAGAGSSSVDKVGWCGGMTARGAGW